MLFEVDEFMTLISQIRLLSLLSEMLENGKFPISIYLLNNENTNR
ncbi:hypothetical protein T05_11052 [Trichinella murrelli]|uniref:Uncharacterized protein n=1 Tax=Trichinella murrelli TaxID=144512 RepID=A0A0V0SR33_9BILA|nr:hypothetical protein T05_11052 [Trichinella murrelli]